MNREDEIVARLDSIIKLLQDMIILQATMAKGNKEALRRMLGIRTARISKISQVLK